jgi:hypothetical protein
MVRTAALGRPIFVSRILAIEQVGTRSPDGAARLTLNGSIPPMLSSLF